MPDAAEPQDDLRSDLNAAFEAAEEQEPAAGDPAPQDPSTPSVPAEAPSQVETEAAARARDEKGRFARKDGAAAPPAEAPQTAQDPATAPQTPVPPSQPAPQVRAPQSWRPDVRERFAALPAEVQAEVVRREREVDAALKESVQARRAVSELQQIVQPHLATLQAEGVTPAQGFANFLSTATMLRTGSPEVKARAIANVIKQYGIDIEQLAAAIDGQPVQPAQQMPLRDPRVDELLTRINQAEQTRMQRARQAEEAAVQDFAAQHEFFEDVRMEMADLIDLASKRGVALSYEEAYSRAVAARPEIAQVLRQRESASSVRNGQPSIARSKAAASSIRSKPVTSAPAPVKDADDLRGAIEQAFDQVEGR
jgi:sulfur carrier protein ThiS